MKLLTITIITLLTVQWIIQNWLNDYRCICWLAEPPYTVFGVLEFPNLETLALQQAEPLITIEEARDRQVELFHKRSAEKFAEWKRNKK